MASHQLNYDSISVNKPRVAGSGASMYVVSVRCVCGSQFRGAGASYVEASQKLHAAFAAHEQMMDHRAKAPDNQASLRRSVDAGERAR